MANLFNTPNYLFTWKDVKTFLLRSQYNELLNFVTQEFFNNQYKPNGLPSFLDPSFTLSLTKFEDDCGCSKSNTSKVQTDSKSIKDRLLQAEKKVEELETSEAIAQIELSKSWKVLDFERTSRNINSAPALEALKTAIIESDPTLSTKIPPAKTALNNQNLAIPFNDLEIKATIFITFQSSLKAAKESLLGVQKEYNQALISSEFAYEDALNIFNKAVKAYNEGPTPTTLQNKETAEKNLIAARQKISEIKGLLGTDAGCRDFESNDFCTPKFKYIRKKSISDKQLSEKNLQLDFTTTGLTVGSVLWLYYYERMGIFKILGALMDDYNYKGKFTISGSRKNENGSPITYSILMDMICTLHRLGMSSNLRDRICTYQRSLGVSIENSLGIESERNQGFMQNFNKLIENMLEYYKSKQLAVAINTGNQPRSSVSTQTTILDTMQLLKQQFEPFQYGRNAINTFLGIATVQATLCLVNMLRTEIGIPAQYEKPEEFIPAAYRILVEKRGITSPNEANRFIIYDNCASYGLRLLTDIETADITQLTTIGVGATLDLWLDDVEGWVEGYRNAYASVPEGAEAMV